MPFLMPLPITTNDSAQRSDLMTAKPYGSEAKIRNPQSEIRTRKVPSPWCLVTFRPLISDLRPPTSILRPMLGYLVPITEQNASGKSLLFILGNSMLR
jgi:hypothetical protein